MRRLFGTPLAKLLAGFCGCLAQAAVAQLTPLNDDELALSTGQAMIKVQEFNDFTQSDGSKLDFTRISLGGVLEVNANIDRATVMRYDRDDCGDCGNGNYKTASTTYPDGAVDFKDLLAGFDPDAGKEADAQLRNISLGTVDEDGNVIPVVMEDPYIEFVWDEFEGERVLVGFRVGQHNTSGVMGNTIDTISGTVQPLVNVLASAIGIDLQANINFDFSGTRTGGNINKDQTTCVTNESNCNTILTLAGNEAQLRPVEYNLLDNASKLFMSLSSIAVDYPEVIPGGGTSPTAQSGFWVNMQYDIATDTGLRAFTELYEHPDNYFEGNPIADAVYNSAVHQY